MSTLNSLDLKTLGSQLILYFNPPDTDASQHFWNHMSTLESRMRHKSRSSHINFFIFIYIYCWMWVSPVVTNLVKMLGIEGRFTPWTVKSDHGRWPFPMVRFDGPTSMGRFLKKTIYKAFGSLTRCKPNVDQRGMTMHASKTECVDSSNICSKRTILKKK